MRLLEIGALGREQVRHHAAMTPVHCADAVAQAARHCARVWEEFARALEERDTGNARAIARKVLWPRPADDQ
ncbi:hypothetical protein ACFYOT_35490 [Saccharothrix saharensis]|uniref:hypothetical protein n=1 Tax=Saccharothrix saharensis TaxID=571190 RepID=UPI00367540DD